MINMSRKRSRKKWFAGFGTAITVAVVLVLFALWEVISAWVQEGISAFGLLPVTIILIIVIFAVVLVSGLGVRGLVRRISR